ncbi:hypothetical protein F2Q70_00006013 [Brassica cretica]|uniref:Uncharacterized protein n=1 Tax=Brassica cretica TaxID=69181 RepID=A0A8S9IMF6_BRACR|nr:hypothetical protein F2Q70_00006013 [Brassica cretica]
MVVTSLTTSWRVVAPATSSEDEDGGKEGGDGGVGERGGDGGKDEWFRKQSIVYAVRDYQPLKESSVACSATTTDGARSLTMRCGLITDVSFSEDRIMSSCVTPLVRKESSPVFFKYWYLRESARMGVKQALRSIDAFPIAE